MSADAASGAGPGAGEGQTGQPSEAELRAAYEAELARITSADMMLQAAVSLLNIGGRRLGAQAPGEQGVGAAPAVERDLEQVRDAIDGVRALLDVLERRLPGELGPLRDALSQLQMAYAREIQASGEGAAGAGEQPSGRGSGAADAGGGQARGEGEEPPQQGQRGPGPAESSGRLWVPGR